MKCTIIPRLAVLGLLTPAVGVAYEFNPAVSVGEIFTNNVTLAPKGQEESAWVTRVSPTINLSNISRHFQFEIDYALEGLFYAGDSSATRCSISSVPLACSI